MNFGKGAAVFALLVDAIVYLLYGHPVMSAGWIGLAAVTTWMLPAR